MNEIVEIMDTMGSTRNMEFHANEKVLLYETGNALMLWNLNYDKKIKLHTHPDKIGCFLFCGKGQKYIISIDVSQNPTIIFSDWMSFRKICQKKVLKKVSQSMNTKGIYIDRKKMIIFIENFQDGINSRMILTEIKNDSLNVSHIETLKELTDCLSIHYFDFKMNISLVTIERFCIKIWKIVQDRFFLENRVHSKEEISETFLHSERNLLYFITSKNILNVVNQEGELMTKIKCSNIITSLSGNDQNLFLGNSKGTIKIVTMTSFNVINEIPIVKLKNAKNERNTFHVNDFSNNDSDQENLSIVLLKASSSFLLSTIFSNGTLVIYDLQRKKIISSISGHFLKINQISINPYKKDSFVSASNDGTIQIWEISDNKWIPQNLDCSALIDINVPNHLFENKLSISHKEKTNDKSNLIKYNPFKIKNLCFHPQKPLIYATNNKGYLLIWDLRTRKHMVSKQIFPFKICQMSFYKTGEYLAVILSNGESVLINSTTFLVVANIENQWLNKDQTSKYFKGVYILNDEKDNTNYKDEKASKCINFEVISSNTSNKIRLQQIFKLNNIYNATVLVNYCVEAPYQQFAIHTSNEYIVILLSLGLIEIFKIKTGELRGKIMIPKFSNYFCIDPSGLYLSVSSPYALKRKNSLERLDESVTSDNLSKSQSFFSDIAENGTMTKNDLHKISIYEIGTGNGVGEIEGLNPITYQQFSSEGSFLMAGTNEGLIYIWSLTSDLYENVKSMLTAINVDQDYWKNYPIYLEESKSQMEINVQPEIKNENNKIKQIKEKHFINSNEKDNAKIYKESTFISKMNSKKYQEENHKPFNHNKEKKDIINEAGENYIMDSNEKIKLVSPGKKIILPDPLDLNEDISSKYSNDFQRKGKTSKIRSIQFSPLGKRSNSVKKFEKFNPLFQDYFYNIHNR